MLRLAIANIHRPGALTPTVVLSLGLGLALLVTVIEIDGNLRRQFTAALPEKAPSFFFLDIPAADADALRRLRARPGAGATLERVPMLRGRIVAANGIKAENLKPAGRLAWVLQSDRGITYAPTVPAGSRIVAGEWWSADYSGPPLVSFESKTAHGSRPEDRRYHHRQRARPQHHGAHRQSAHRRLGEPRHQFRAGVLAQHVRRRAAHRHRHADLPDGGTPAEETALLKALADAFPTVTAVRVKDALDAVGGIVEQPGARRSAARARSR